MQTFERILILIVGLTLTAYLAAQAYTYEQPPQAVKIGGFYPPAQGIQSYFGPTLKVSEILLVLHLGSQKPLQIRLQALSTDYRVALTQGAPCIVIYSRANTLIGPCYTFTTIAIGDTENVTLTIEAPSFQQQDVTSGYYRVAYGAPQQLTQQCGGQNDLFLNTTELLNPNQNGCVSIQLVQVGYVWVGGGHG